MVQSASSCETFLKVYIRSERYFRKIKTKLISNTFKHRKQDKIIYIAINYYLLLSESTDNKNYSVVIYIVNFNFLLHKVNNQKKWE